MSFLIFDEDYPFFFFIIDMLRGIGHGVWGGGIGSLQDFGVFRLLLFITTIVFKYPGIRDSAGCLRGKTKKLVCALGIWTRGGSR